MTTPRVMRATSAISRAESASVGITIESAPDRPKLGSQPSFTEKTAIRIMPSQKLGTASSADHGA